MPTVHAREAVMRAKPGLSAFHDDPTSAGASLAPLLAFAREHIPDSALAASPALLMATAGLRSVDPPAASAILRSCRAARPTRPSASATNGPRFSPAPGRVSTPGSPPTTPRARSAPLPRTRSASSNSAARPCRSRFAPSANPRRVSRRARRRARRKWSVYTHSALGLGQEAAREAHEAALLASVPQDGSRTVPDPCTPRGVRGGDGFERRLRDAFVATPSTLRSAFGTSRELHGVSRGRGSTHRGRGALRARALRRRGFVSAASSRSFPGD